MSEAELHVLRARLIGGQMNKARRGELWMRPPLGFIVNARGQLIIDPDEQVQHTVRLVFETFRRAGSAGAVVRQFRNDGLLFPRRLATGPRARTLVFGRLDHHRVLQILHNPRYAGAYVYGRTRQRKVLLPGQMRHRRLPRDDWKVFLPNVHPGYLTWEEYEANQTTLRQNAGGYGWDRRRSAAREGVALLQGLVICGRCGDRMTVRYEMHRGHPEPVYACQRRGIATATRHCQMIHGAPFDAAISDLVLEALTPASLDVAFEVFEELRAREADIDRARRAHVARAREDAELAQRQFLAVRPEHRLVADALEREWNEALRRLAEAEEEYRRAAQAPPRVLTAELRDRVTSLLADLPRVWHDPRTPARERKRILRLLIEDVTFVRAEDVSRMSVRWKGGATCVIERPCPLSAADLRRTPSEIVEEIRALATEQTDGQIARTLNQRSRRTGTGQAFTSTYVQFVRYTYDIKSYADHLQQAGWVTADHIAQQLQIHPTTAKKFAHAGILRAVRGDDKGTIFFEPPRGALPTAHPGKRRRDRAHYAPLSTELHRSEGSPAV
jgi:hypothetical protein